MEYIALKSFPHYDEAAPLVEGMGFVLVDLKITPQKNVTRISAVIASKDASVKVGVDDCAKVHRALQARLEALLGTEDVSMELLSPGTDRNIKNAAEFALFVGRGVRVWDKEITDWVSGKIISADERELTLETDGGQQKIFEHNNIAKAKFLD